MNKRRGMGVGARRHAAGNHRALNDAIIKVVNTPDMKDLFNKGGLEPRTNTPREFAAFVKSQLEKIAQAHQAGGLNVGIVCS
jgi:tripartite-type tricarboxylate transporter receptor subunit TctC